MKLEKLIYFKKRNIFKEKKNKWITVYQLFESVGRGLQHLKGRFNGFLEQFGGGYSSEYTSRARGNFRSLNDLLLGSEGVQGYYQGDQFPNIPRELRKR